MAYVYATAAIYCMSLVVRKPDFRICGNSEADQRLCFRYTDSTIPGLPSKVLVNPLKPTRLGFMVIKFPFKRKVCQVYRVKYGWGRIW